MDKFTKVVKTQAQGEKNVDNEIVYSNDYLTLKNKNDWTYVVESDRIIVLPYVKDEGYVYLRSEVVPPWIEKHQTSSSQMRNTQQFLTVISGTIEKGEEPAQTLRRELYEEAGIALNQFFNFDIEGPFFESKGNTSAFYICLMELSYTDYKMVTAVGDGTKAEAVAKTLRVSIADLDEIRINDMATKVLVDKLKHVYNL